MTDPLAAPPPRAFYLAGGRGDLFAVLSPAAQRDGNRPGVLFVPPFAEELNRSRRMVALQARRLSALGYDVLLLDLYGTGDSAGDFADARWDIWLADIAAGIAWLKARGKPVILWGLRLGAILAAEAARNEANLPMMLWQPVSSGRSYMTQFLRIRLAAGLARSADAGETMQSLRDRLAAAEMLEVAGYALAPDLVAAIEARELAALRPRSKVYWCEVSADPDRALSPAARRTLEAWGDASMVETKVVGGDQFWATQEITISQPLLDQTSELFARGIP